MPLLAVSISTFLEVSLHVCCFKSPMNSKNILTMPEMSENKLPKPTLIFKNYQIHNSIDSIFQILSNSSPILQLLRDDSTIPNVFLCDFHLLFSWFNDPILGGAGWGEGQQWRRWVYHVSFWVLGHHTLNPSVNNDNQAVKKKIKLTETQMP